MEISSYGKERGASLNDLAPGVLERLQVIADAAEMDLGINAVRNGTHVAGSDHYKGLAVDVGFLGGESIGVGPTTFPGMAARATQLQATAARVAGEVRLRVNWGPAGRFIQQVGPLPFGTRKDELDHRNHVHFGFHP